MPASPATSRGHSRSIARLKPGVSVKQAATEARTLWSALIHDYPEMKETGIRVMRLMDN